MQQLRYLSGTTTDEIWEQLNEDFASIESLSDYHVILQHSGKEIALDISIHLGGADEGGYETTSFTAAITPQHGFKFAIHPDDFFHEIGKWFGLEDKIIGYPEFDEALVIKTNDTLKVHNLFADSDARLVFQNLSGFSLGIVTHGEGKPEVLELNIQSGIIDAGVLRGVYEAYHSVLVELDKA